MTDTNSGDTVRVDRSLRVLPEEEIEEVKAILAEQRPDHDLVAPVDVLALGAALEQFGLNHVFLVRIASAELQALVEELDPTYLLVILDNIAELQEWYPEHTVVVPMGSAELRAILDQVSIDYFLVQYVDSSRLRYEVAVQDLSPSVDTLQRHFRPFALDGGTRSRQASVDATSDLRMYLVRHRLWDDTDDSVPIIVSMRDRSVLG